MFKNKITLATLITLTTLLFSQQTFAQGLVNVDRAQLDLQRENSCNIIFKKLSDYQCAGYLDRPSLYTNADDNQNMICLRLFEIYVINDCDSKARIMKTKEPDAQGEVIESPSTRIPEGSVCGKENYKDYIGKNSDKIDYSKLKEPYRIICHNCPITMDYSPTRINFNLDKDKTVRSITCG